MLAKLQIDGVAENRAAQTIGEVCLATSSKFFQLLNLPKRDTFKALNLL